MAVKILEGKAKPATMPIESADKFEFTINGTVAKQIGITIPEDLAQYVIE